MQRFGGAVETTTAGYFAYVIYRMSDYDHSKLFEVLMGDHPLTHKMLGATLLGLEEIATAALIPLSIIAADGIVDMVKGTHHYLGMQIWKDLTPNSETKERIQKGIEDMLEKFEKKLF